MNNKVLTIASNVLFVKGYNKNLIIDLQNDCWYHVDFELENDQAISNLKSDDLDYMLDEGMIFEIPVDVKSRLAPFSMEYSTPNELENAIIDRNSKSNYSIAKAVEWLNKQRNKHLQIRWYDECRIEDLDLIIELTNESSCESIDIIVKYDKQFDLIMEKKGQALKISTIVFHSVPNDFIVENLKSNQVFFTKEKISSSNNCGQISPYIFSQNQSHILKSINYNSCLFKKIGIDVDGFIKNCPSANQFSHHIDQIDISLPNLLKSIHKHGLGEITKDEVKVCQSCEFRYICSDCRIFTDNPNDKYSRPSKCTYNPYISKWEGEEGYYTLSESGVISDENSFSIDHDRIASINEKLWGEA